MLVVHFFGFATVNMSPVVLCLLGVLLVLTLDLLQGSISCSLYFSCKDLFSVMGLQVLVLAFVKGYRVRLQLCTADVWLTLWFRMGSRMHKQRMPPEVLPTPRLTGQVSACGVHCRDSELCRIGG